MIEVETFGLLPSYWSGEACASKILLLSLGRKLSLRTFDVAVIVEEAKEQSIADVAFLTRIEANEFLEEESIDLKAQKEKTENFDVAQFRAFIIIDTPIEEYIELRCQEPISGNRIACKVLASHRDRQQNLMKLKMKKKKASPVRHVQKLRGGEAYQNAHLLREADLLHQLRGAPGILPLIAKVEGDDSCIHIFTPFCDAGDLLDRLEASPILPERETAHIVASLARALVSCHTRGIVHRDIKPGNVLFRRYASSNGSLHVATSHELHHVSTDIKYGTSCTTTSEHDNLPQVFLAEFGHAGSIQHPWERLDDPHVGTGPFHALELIQRSYDHRVNNWSVGVLMHLMLTGTLPFVQHLAEDAPDADIHAAILSNKLSLDVSLLSASAQDLLKGMLCKNPEHRLTLQQVLHHPWLVFKLRPAEGTLRNQAHAKIGARGCETQPTI
ncbi:hypothetical protein L7F22_016731 [Adiantum nelumboides]|nr:hypothetical protein [Adiantum nelumboides]